MSVSHARVPAAVPPIVVTGDEIPGLLEVLGRVPDPRRPGGVRHALVAVLMISVIAVLAGARNLREIGDEAADLPPTNPGLGGCPLVCAKVAAGGCERGHDPPGHP